MVNIQIYGTNDFLESKDSKITYIKTSGDLSDISKVNSSFSWSLKFPKSPNNTRVLGGLGLVGSTSEVPYKKVYCNLLDNGLPIVQKGILNIKSTKGDYYNIYIQEGFVDFLRDIKTDTLSDLDLSELDHQRDYTTINNSLDLSLPYAYLIADVNGAFNPDQNNTTNLRSAFMSPFANVGHIWDLIFDNYGWTYEINANTLQSIRDTWMSYPSEIVLDDQFNQNVLNSTTQNENISQYVSGTGLQTEVYISIPLIDNNIILNYIEPLNDYDFKVNTTGNYVFNINEVTFINPTSNTSNKSIKLFVNNSEVIGFSNNSTVYLNEGDVFRFYVFFLVSQFGTGVTYDVSIYFFSSNIFYILDTGQVSFTKALLKFKVNTFLKEIMTREALTAFVDSENRVVKFLTLTERFEQNVTDWSNRYIDRKNETYTYSKYGQNNLLKHKYQDELSDFNDGNINVNNDNLEEEKTIYTSIGYSPNNELTTFIDNGTTYLVPQIPTFEVDVKEDKDTGDLIGDYKFLKDRFFFVKADTTTNSIYIDYQLANNIPIVSTRDVLFNNIVFNKYNDFNRIGNGTKIHQIDIALSLSDVLQLNLENIYYFKQQSAFYFLNRLKYQTGKITTGEFLKIDLTKKIEVSGSDTFDDSVDSCNSSPFQTIYIESGNDIIEIGDKVFVKDGNDQFVLIDNNDYYIKDFDNNKSYRVINGVITTIIDC